LILESETASDTTLTFAEEDLRLLWNTVNLIASRFSHQEKGNNPRTEPVTNQQLCAEYQHEVKLELFLLSG